MRNIKLKHGLLLFVFSICSNSFSQGPPPTNSVTITPTTNTTDVKGNIKASGLVEASSLKAAGLATGNAFVANPVYANAYGDLVTGYKVGYFSIPPAAFRLNLHLYSDATYFYQSDDYVVYTGSYVGFFTGSDDKFLLAPLNFPHKSKLSSLKISFYSYNAKFIQGAIIRSSFNDSPGETTIFSFNTPVANVTTVVAEFPINLIEIDNQNFVYTLQLKSSTNNWGITSIKGVSIEYHDF